MTKLKGNLMRQSALAVSAYVLMGSAASAQQVFATDVIVQGSLCVGIDCTNAEAFGFDTIRMKENNLRIRADDTSNDASFPENDWQLTFNDETNGGQEKFSIDDITAGRTPFTLRAGAPTNSLYLDSQGDVGLGTDNPVTELHVVDGDSPAIRIEQDGSSGFTAHTWDISGNETNFFVRNVTDGSRLPLRIFPTARDDALVLRDDRAGFGTDDPQVPMHVVRTTRTNADMIRLESNGASIMRLVDTNSGTEFTFQNQASTFRVASPLVPGPELLLTETGDLTITGELTTAGSCSVGCDRVFDEDYALKPLAEHQSLMWENKHLPNVGPTAEDGPMNLSQKVGGILNELEHAHIYIGQLHERLETLETRLESLERE